MNVATKAYAAGIFDGEGYVDIEKQTQYAANKSPSYRLRVIISQKDGLLMDWLINNIGGSVRKERNGKLYIYRWRIYSNKAEQFLSQIMPYSNIKKEQIIIALNFAQVKKSYLSSLKGKRGFRSLTSTEVKWCIDTKEKLKLSKKNYILYSQDGAPTTTKRKELLEDNMQ